jgi:hypothetical protein
MAMSVDVHPQDDTEVTMRQREGTVWISIRTDREDVTIFLQDGIATKIRQALDAAGGAECAGAS